MGDDTLSTILNSLPLAVLYIRDQNIVYANNAVTKMFGFDPSEVIGKNARILYRSDADYEAIGKPIYDTLTNSEMNTGMYPFRTKAEKDIVCELTAMRAMGSSQDTEAVLMFEDITDRLVAEKEITDSEEKYKSLLENTHDIIISISREGKFIHVNAPWRNTFGYSNEELGSISMETIIQEKFLSTFREQFAMALSNESTKNLDVYCRKKDGSQIILEGNLIPRCFGDKVVAVWGFYRDVTEQRKTQEEIKMKIEELEQFNKLVIDRELKMIELKKTIKKLQEQIMERQGGV